MKRLARLALVISTVSAVLAAVAPNALAVAPAVAASNVFPVVQANSGPLGDLTITEATPGQLVAGDIVTVRFRDAGGGSTYHLNSTPVVSGTNGLTATLAVTSSSGMLNDQVLITVQTPSVGSFPGVVTLAQLRAAVDGVAVSGNNIVTVSDSGGTIPTTTTSNAKAIGTSPKATFAASSQPTVLSTSSNQTAGSLLITEPTKTFFKTGDVITFSVRDAFGSADTIGLNATPSASGGGMLVSVSGISGPTVQPNESAFKLRIDEQDPSNGSASTIQISNLVYNLAQAPLGPVTISATVTSGSEASLEHIFPGRVVNANVGGNTSTTSAGQPVVLNDQIDQLAGNVMVAATPDTLKAGDTFTMEIQEPGVTFSDPPLASTTSGNGALVSASAVLNEMETAATWTMATGNTTAMTMVIGPISYDLSAANPGAIVKVRVSGNAGGSFTSQVVPNAQVAPLSSSLFTASSAPVSSTGEAGDIVYQEVAALLAPTGGSIVLLSPYATQIAAYRTTFSAIPSAVVEPGSGLVLGSPTVNSSTTNITTAAGVISAPAQTAIVFPVVTGGTSPARVTFTGISYSLGSYVPPAALVGTGAVNSGSTTGSGTSMSGNQYVNSINGRGLATPGDTTAPVASMTAPAKPFQKAEAFSVSWSGSDTSGVTSYDVFYKKAPYNGDFGAPIPWKSATTTTSSVFTGLPGETYCFFVQARDAAGNLSVASGERCTAVPIDDKTLSASSGSWARKTGSGYYLNTYSKSSSKNAELSLSGVQTKRLGILVTKCPNCGTIQVYQDATLLKKINLDSPSTKKQQLIPVTSVPYSTVQTGTIRVKIITTSKAVLIEGLATSRS